MIVTFVRGEDTKQAILDAAEGLFGEQGYAATSMRSIVAAAGVNLAAIHYHFGSKEALLEAVVDRRGKPLEHGRFEHLTRFEAEAGGNGPAVEQILEAFLAPAIRLTRDPSGGGRRFVQLVGRLLGEPGEGFRKAFTQQFGPTVARFGAALERALPGTLKEELFWKMFFSAGAMAHTLRSAGLVRALSDGLCDDSDGEMVLKRLIAFLAAGMRAPLPVIGPIQGS
jgi:AcrR family transcriptional regulator